MTRQRRHFTPEQKVAILRRHLLEKSPRLRPLRRARHRRQPLLPLAEAVLRERRRRLRPTTANAARPTHDAKDRKIAALEAKLQRKNEVLAELMEEHVQLKKELGEL